MPVTDPKTQATSALNVYFQRGQSILRFLGNGKIEKALTMLRRQAAAFHNFCAADATLKHKGIDVGLEPTVQVLVANIREQEELIAEHLRRVLAEMQDELSRNRRARQSIGKYRSGALAQSRILSQAV